MVCGRSHGRLINMGAKQSTANVELHSSNVDKGRPHQYEQIDDDRLLSNQGTYKHNSDNNKNVTGEQTLQPVPTNEPLDLNSQKSEIPCGVTASCNAASTQAITNSPGINKRFHPYDEITEEQLTLNQKAIHEVKLKKKGSPKEKVGKKKKGEQKNPEIVGNQNSSIADSLKPSPADSPKTSARYRPYDEITEEQLAASRNAKKTEKEGKSNQNKSPKVKAEKNKKNVTAEVGENTSHDTAPTNHSDNQKKIPRTHTYDEITDEQLAMNREATELNKNEKLVPKDNPKEKVDKKKQKVEKASKQVDNHIALGSNLTPGTKSSNLNDRYHPYDEITEEELASSRKAIQEMKGDKQKWIAGKEKQELTEDSEPAEYINAALIAASSTPSLDSIGKDDLYVNDTYDDNIKDLYAVPQKKQAKTKIQTELNYVEVEFNPATSKPEVKCTYSPTDYSTVVPNGGRFVLES